MQSMVGMAVLDAMTKNSCGDTNISAGMLHGSERMVGVRLTGIGTDRILIQTPRYIDATILGL